MSRTAVQPVKSGPSRNSCNLRFMNLTKRRVNIIWIDFLGYARTYGTLSPNKSFDIHTYENHPWMCEDFSTKTRMLLNKEFLFYPSESPPDEDYPEAHHYLMHQIDANFFGELEHYFIPPMLIKEVQVVNITLPVFSLKEISAEAVIKHIHNVEDINTLNLPFQLKNMLQKFYP